jgi:hypothetical protein
MRISGSGLQRPTWPCYLKPCRCLLGYMGVHPAPFSAWDGSIFEDTFTFRCPPRFPTDAMMSTD